jgi:predicted SPOUT superfamily RNA methylase MTH1
VEVERPKMTVSLALPGSIVDNAQSPPLRTYLAGQLARAIVIFRIDEVIVYDDKLSKNGLPPLQLSPNYASL